MDFVAATADVKVWRHDRDVGHRRHLPKGIRHRQSGAGRQRQRHLQGHSRAPVGRVQPARGSAGREDAAGAGRTRREGRRESRRHRPGHHHRACAADVACTVLDTRWRARRPRVRRGRVHRAEQRAHGGHDCRRDRRAVAGRAGGHRHPGRLPSARASVSTRSIIGIGSLAKTVVGFFAGIVGSQFIVARPLPRAFVFFTATVAHAIIFVGLYRVIDRGYTPGHGRRDLQPGRRQRAGRRAGFSDCRLPAGLRRSPAVDGRRDADQPTAGLTLQADLGLQGLGARS